MKDGKVLGFTVMYRSALSERNLTIFQESAKRAGIKIDLQLLTPAAAWKNIMEKEYEISSQAWGSLLFPNPETAWHSSLADQKNNNNVTGFRSERVDELCAEYDREYDVQKRVELVQQIDALIYEQYPYVLGWYKPAQRVVYWNKFGTPEPFGSGRYSRESSNGHLTDYWWYDEGKATQLAAALADPEGKLTMEAPRENVMFWQIWGEKKAAAAADADASVEPTEGANEVEGGDEVE